MYTDKRIHQKAQSEEKKSKHHSRAERIAAYGDFAEVKSPHMLQQPLKTPGKKEAATRNIAPSKIGIKSSLRVVVRKRAP